MTSASPAEPGKLGRQEPRWLTVDERAAWVATVGLFTRLPTALDARMQRDAGLTFFEYMVLAMLSEQPDFTMQMTDLAEVSSSSLSRLSHVAGRLERQGFLTRERIPGPGRRTNAVLTEAGHEKVVETAPGHVAAVRELFIDALTADQLKALTQIGRTVIPGLSTPPGTYD